MHKNCCWNICSKAAIWKIKGWILEETALASCPLAALALAILNIRLQLSDSLIRQ
jgi:hypothetical protein